MKRWTARKLRRLAGRLDPIVINVTLDGRKLAAVYAPYQGPEDDRTAA